MIGEYYCPTIHCWKQSNSYSQSGSYSQSNSYSISSIGAGEKDECPQMAHSCHSPYPQEEARTRDKILPTRLAAIMHQQNHGEDGTRTAEGMGRHSEHDTR